MKSPALLFPHQIPVVPLVWPVIWLHFVSCGPWCKACLLNSLDTQSCWPDMFPFANVTSPSNLTVLARLPCCSGLIAVRLKENRLGSVHNVLFSEAARRTFWLVGTTTKSKKKTQKQELGLVTLMLECSIKCPSNRHSSGRLSHQWNAAVMMLVVFHNIKINKEKWLQVTPTKRIQIKSQNIWLIYW